MIIHTKDAINLLSKFTWRRGMNVLKMVTGFFISKIFGKPYVFGFPVSVSIEPTTSCNLRCPECISGLRAFTRPTGMMHVDFHKEIVNQLFRDIFYMIFYFQGEPFLNTALLEMISNAAAKKIYTATSTNGHYINESTAQKIVASGLDRLIISIDGITQEVYEQYRIGGNLDKVLEGTKNILHARKKLKSAKPFVVFQFLVVHPNEHQIPLAKKMAKELGVDKIVFKTAQIYDYQNGSELIPSNPHYSRYRKNGETYELKNKLLNQCWRLWHSSVITWDGKIVPCCFDKDASHSMGELTTLSFQEIWQGSQYMNFRHLLLSSRKEIDICSNCTEGTTVFG